MALQLLCPTPAPHWEQKEMLGKEIPQGTTQAAFGWLEMFQKSFLTIQSFRKRGYNADLSSPPVHSEAPSVSFLSLFTVFTQAAVPQGRHPHHHRECKGRGCFLELMSLNLGWFGSV